MSGKDVLCFILMALAILVVLWRIEDRLDIIISKMPVPTTEVKR